MAQQTFIGSDIAKDVLLNKIQPNDTELYAAVGTAQAEITAARDGAVSLLAKEQAQDTATTTVTAEVTAARVGLGSLLLKEQAQDTATTTVTAEVTAARDGAVSLLAKEQAQDTAIAALVAGSGVTISATDTTVGTLGDKMLPGTNVTFELGSTGGNETLTVNVEIPGGLSIFAFNNFI